VGTVAKKLGVSRRTLFTLRQDKQIQDAVSSVMIEALKTDLVDVLKSLTNQAKKGNVGAARVILEYAEKLWNVEVEARRELANLKTALLKALADVSPELKERFANELLTIAVDGGNLRGDQIWNPGRSLPPGSR